MITLFAGARAARTPLLEAAVEAVEEAAGPFTKEQIRREVVRRLPDANSFRTYGATEQALRELEEHHLIERVSGQARPRVWWVAR